jgi:hypothetical protein
MTMDQFAAGVDGGTGVVARWVPGVVVTGGDPADARELMTAMVASVGDDPTAGQLIALLRDDHRFNHGRIDLAAAVATPDGVRVFVRGAMEVRTQTNETIAGPDPVEQDLPAASALWIGQGGPPVVQGHPVINLKLGVVPGRGAVLYQVAAPTDVAVSPPAEAAQPAVAAAPSPPAPAAPVPVSPAPGASPSLDAVPPPVAVPPAVALPPPAAAPRPAAPIPPAPAPLPANAVDTELPEARPFQSVDWNDPAAVETRQPLPVLDRADSPANGSADGPAGSPADQAASPSGDEVLGVRCSRGHFNNPKAGYCQLCGISMVHLTARLEPGPRPTLGFAVFADGATYAMDRSYLIGRKPRPDPASGLTALMAQDASQSVSREHAELRVEGWDVMYVDLGSTNGSFLWQANSRTWMPIEANTPIVLESGATVSVGRMTFVFEGAAKAVEGGSP